MCGFAGFIDPRPRYNLGERLEIATRMSDTLVHRGPDDSGVWADPDFGVALGHRRLAIIDLTQQGHQPMMSSCGQYAIVFNGEIYNYLEIREELDTLRAGGGSVAFTGWASNSDTEVILEAVRQWGICAAVKKFVGMFAFALWDRQERVMHLARDRLGEKPLYYGSTDGVFVFASELKALRAHPRWQDDVDRGALALMMRHNYIPAPYSIYRGIYKLLPGTILSIPAESVGMAGIHQRNIVSPDSKPTQPSGYWSAWQVASNGISNPFSGSAEEGVEQLGVLLKQAIRLQMIADVPLGAFLSGGVDSSTIVALMQEVGNAPVKTFTIGFKEAGYDEAEHASAVARHLGTDHTELYVSPKDAMAVIPKLPQLYDEPFSDSSQIPTFLISQLARKRVTVSLSGDGGDELFGGYNRYFWGRSIWKKIGWIPRPARSRLASALRAVSPMGWDRGFSMIGPLLPAALRETASGDKLHKLADILGVGCPGEMYRQLVSHWKRPGEVVTGGIEPPTALSDSNALVNFDDFTQRMMYLDTVSYLPDDILVKVDRAAMGVSLETRVPFLDHRVVEFAWRLPLDLKIRQGQGKWVLRQLLHKYVPKELIDRPKMGFGVPLDSWLRGPLKEWAEALLNEPRLRREGFFNPVAIHEKWREHQSGVRNWQYHLWDVLMFQAWLEASRNPSS